jgi:hypothetical protein
MALSRQAISSPDSSLVGRLWVVWLSPSMSATVRRLTHAATTNEMSRIPNNRTPPF